MNDGVALLLERMKTHPEEFVIEEGIVRKWDGLVRSYEGVLPPEDIKAYKEALNTLLQQQFTEKVMEELVDPKKSDSWVDSIMQAKGISLAGTTRVGSLVGNVNAIQNGGSWGTSSITLEHHEHMKAHLEAMQEAEKRKIKKLEEKKHKTLFGKLFNYA